MDKLTDIYQFVWKELKLPSDIHFYSAIAPCFTPHNRLHTIGCTHKTPCNSAKTLDTNTAVVRELTFIVSNATL